MHSDEVTVMRKVMTALVLAALLVWASAAYAAESVDCLMCHSDKAEGKGVHPAVGMGCETCHTSIDASEVPHKIDHSTPKGIGTPEPDLCFNCHDKAKITEGMSVHAPVAAGMCTGCHDPHKGAKEKLLKGEAPDLCFNCHERTKFLGTVVHSPVSQGMCTTCHLPHSSMVNSLLVEKGSALCFSCHDKDNFTGPVVHKPVAEGMCTDCHKPHASQNDSLLARKGNVLCRKCHSEVEKNPHAIIGFSSRDGGGHPVRGRKDPKMPGKVFGCQSCHMPHASKEVRLFRYPAKSAFDLCSNCHNF